MQNKYLKLIDNRNSDLWNDMLSKFKIHLEKSPEPSYITSYEDDVITIKINEGNINPAPFTHELLHIYLKSKNIWIARDIIEKIEKNNKLFFIFSDSLKSHIGNCLEHQKMLPLYLDRGFDNKLFVGDFALKIMKDDKFSKLKKEYAKKRVVNREAVDVFIGKFFSMKVSNNNRFSYDKYFNGLAKIDGQLFEVLNTFWEEWLEFNIDSDDYKKILDPFINNLNSWAKEKTII
ncbi:MAG TPA: hypothetical protein VFM70_05420 [Salinimicrobium sp.]|nr:hypothetical protein [Salinimicrobium sp.]